MTKEGFPGTCRGVSVKRLTAQIGAWDKCRYNAFTLIELVLVVSIIAVLGALVLSTVGYARKKGARAKTETEMAAMSAACENYKADKGVYPTSTDTNGLDPTTGTIANYKTPSRYLYGELSGDHDFDGTPDASAQSFMTFKPALLLRDDMSNPPSSTNPVTAICDPFTNSYGYSTMKASGGVNGFNPTFDLWSVADGAAGTDQTKWIKNW
jgi:prepilin-type N-terminal cleavage/methylation domain-containing protein